MLTRPTAGRDTLLLILLRATGVWLVLLLLRLLLLMLLGWLLLRRLRGQRVRLARDLGTSEINRNGVASWRTTGARTLEVRRRRRWWILLLRRFFLLYISQVLQKKNYQNFLISKLCQLRTLRRRGIESLRILLGRGCAIASRYRCRVALRDRRSHGILVVGRSRGVGH